MDDFVMKDMSQPEMDVDSLQIMKIVNEVNERHTQFVNVVHRRVNSIKVIINWWNKGQVNSAINALNMQNDLGLTMDVVNFTLAANCRLDTLKHENVVTVLP